jgi:hypothetical protein
MSNYKQRGMKMIFVRLLSNDTHPPPRKTKFSPAFAMPCTVCASLSLGKSVKLGSWTCLKTPRSLSWQRKGPERGRRIPKWIPLTQNGGTQEQNYRCVCKVNTLVVVRALQSAVRKGWILSPTKTRVLFSCSF